jgi:hypothetical protein
MDWFERLTGIAGSDYETTRSQLRLEGRYLRSLANDRTFGIGELTTPSLAELRALVQSGSAGRGQLKVGKAAGDVRKMHSAPENAGALFQVASQFNLLEMLDPSVTPEQGVARYEFDRTQGPACAIAAGAATVYRNYLVPVGDVSGQTKTRQLDMLHDLGATLSQQLGCRVDDLYEMRNGYALATREGLCSIGDHILNSGAEEIDQLRGELRIGLHIDVEVTDQMSFPGQHVTQAFCSALPVAYSGIASDLWQPFARLVLEAAYEATLLAGVLNTNRGRSPTVFLTRLGGGAFGNDNAWIVDARARAFDCVRNRNLDVRIVSRS